MISFSNISKKFKSTLAVDIDSLHIDEGEIVGLLGNNGAGKTTLFRLTLDLLKPDSGFIKSKGRIIQKSDHWKQYTCSYLDERFLIGFLKPDEYFELIAHMYKIDGWQLKDIMLRFKDFIHGEIIGKNKLIRHLSSGNKQKVGIIGAFIPMPELIILDEPFNYLDPSSQIILKQIIKELNTERKTTFLISSHNINHVFEISTRILLMERGKIIKEYNNPNSDIQEITGYFNNQIN